MSDSHDDNALAPEHPTRVPIWNAPAKNGGWVLNVSNYTGLLGYLLWKGGPVEVESADLASLHEFEIQQELKDFGAVRFTAKRRQS